MYVEPLADFGQIEARLGVVSTADIERARAALVDASALVRAEAGMNWLDEDGGLLDVPDLIQTVTLSVAVRLYRSDGLRSESIAGYSVAYTDPGVAGLALTADERRLVRQAVGRSSTSVSSVAFEDPWPLTAGYVPVLDGDPLPNPWTPSW